MIGQRYPLYSTARCFQVNISHFETSALNNPQINIEHYMVKGTLCVVPVQMYCQVLISTSFIPQPAVFELQIILRKCTQQPQNGLEHKVKVTSYMFYK